jgi:Tol biopolymer transport system component
MSKPLPRIPVSCLIVAAGLLLVSCDKGPPTRPDNVPPPPPPVQRSTGPIAFVSDRDGTDAIYLANEDGSAVTRLTEGHQPAWSRDRRRIAFVRAFNIYVINADGSGLQFVTQGLYPSWAPDGALIALEDRSSIATVNINGSNRRVVYSKLFATQPVWSPDGRLIAFSVTEFIDFQPGLGLVNADGSDVLYIGPEDAWAPAWSPDGSQIAFLTNSGISVVAADGSGQRQQVAVRDISNVDWTANGSLVFGRWITGSHEGPSRIFISDGVERQLIPDATAPVRQLYRDWQVAWLR